MITAQSIKFLYSQRDQRPLRVTFGREKIAELYDALIKSEREKIALLEKLMEKMNEKK